MKAIRQHEYSVGQAVAFLIAGAIRFGNVATIITKQDKDGERTAIQVNVRKPVEGDGEPDGEPERFLIPRGDLIQSAKGYYGDSGTDFLVKQSPEYQAAIKFEDDLNAPKEEEPEVRQAPTAEPAPAAEAESPVQVDTAATPPPPAEDAPL